MQTRPKSTIYGTDNRYVITYWGFEDCLVQVIESNKVVIQNKKDKKAAAKEAKAIADAKAAEKQSKRNKRPKKPKKMKTPQEIQEEIKEATEIHQAECEALSATENGKSPFIILNGSGTIQVDSAVTCYFKINGERIQIPANHYKNKKRIDPNNSPVIFIVNEPASVSSSHFMTKHWKWLLVMAISTLVGLFCTGSIVGLVLPKWLGLSFTSPIIDGLIGGIVSFLVSISLVSVARKIHHYLTGQELAENDKLNIQVLSPNGSTKSVYHQLLSRKGVTFPESKGITHCVSASQLGSAEIAPHQTQRKRDRSLRGYSSDSASLGQDLVVAERRYSF